MAVDASASSLLVGVLAIADTTTTGRRSTRALTMPATRSMAAAAGTFLRAAAEFHDDHQSIPSECMSSALSTAAPAAPRMVLWPIATNL